MFVATTVSLITLLVLLTSVVGSKKRRKMETAVVGGSVGFGHWKRDVLHFFKRNLTV